MGHARGRCGVEGFVMTDYPLDYDVMNQDDATTNGSNFDDYLKRTYSEVELREREQKKQELMKNPWKWGRYCAQKVLESIFSRRETGS